MADETVPMDVHTQAVNELERSINELQRELALSQNNELITMRMLLQYVVQENEIYKQALNEQQQ